MSHSHLNAPIAAPQRQDNAGIPPVAAPTHDAIAHRAYDIYLKTGEKKGQCTQNWRMAEDSFKPAASSTKAPAGR